MSTLPQYHSQLLAHSSHPPGRCSIGGLHESATYDSFLPRHFGICKYIYRKLKFSFDSQGRLFFLAVRPKSNFLGVFICIFVFQLSGGSIVVPLRVVGTEGTLVSDSMVPTFFNDQRFGTNQQTASDSFEDIEVVSMPALFCVDSRLDRGPRAFASSMCCFLEHFFSMSTEFSIAA